MHSSIRWLAPLVAIGTLAAISPATAQGRDSLRTGMRYRITLPEFPGREGPQFPASRWLAGEFVAYRGDSLVIRPHPTTGAVSVPFSAIAGLEQSRGVSRATSAVENAVGGAAVGALFGLISYNAGQRGAGYNTRWQAVGTTAGWTAAGGFVVGVLFPSERWKRIARPTAH